MSQHDNYFTFPIAFLQLGKALDDVTAAEAAKRANNIVDWCIWQMTLRNAGQQMDADVPNGSTIISEMASRHEAYNEHVDSSGLSFLSAQIVLGIRCHPPLDWEAKRREARKLEALVNHDAGKKLARVRSDVMFQIIEGRMQWRDFAVLASICAGCFDKKRKAVSLRMSQFGVMSLGFGSKKHCHQHNAEALVMHDKTVGRIVEKLRQKGWFVKASPDNGRTTFYSNSLSENQMITYVAKIKAERSLKKKRSLREIQKEVNVAAQLNPEDRAKLEALQARFRERQRRG
jgi:hypothetical protein